MADTVKPVPAAKPMPDWKPTRALCPRCGVMYEVRKVGESYRLAEHLRSEWKLGEWKLCLGSSVLVKKPHELLATDYAFKAS
jgi:hypothetical protein